MLHACALGLGAQTLAIGNWWASGSALLLQHSDLVQAIVALCVAVPHKLHSAVPLTSCHNHHPIEESVTFMGTIPSDGAVALEKVPDSIIMCAERDGAAHVDPQAASSGGVKVCGIGFEVGPTTVRHFSPRVVEYW
tara:strand:- start:146 stop:553 length:408 start_codon:yes stop_codon:yes gene_type:complete